MTGRLLNGLIAAVQARTQMDAEEVGPQGMSGRNPKGGGPKILKFRQRFDDRKTYVLSPGFLERLAAAVSMRTPRQAKGMDAAGWDADGGGINPRMPTAGAGGHSLRGMLDAIQRATPRDAAETSPLGYRFAPDPRAPRYAGLTLQKQDHWAEAFFCNGISHSGSLYTSSTSVAHYSAGTITTTSTQVSPGPHLWTATIPFFTCASPTTSDNRIPGKNYGSLISTDATTYSGALTLINAYNAALAGLEDDGSPVDLTAWIWPEGHAPHALTGTTVGMARWLNSTVGDYNIHRPLYRWRNTGALHIRIRWKEGTTSRDITLAPGDDSTWYDSTLPATVGTVSTINTIILD